MRLYHSHTLLSYNVVNTSRANKTKPISSPGTDKDGQFQKINKYKKQVENQTNKSIQ